MAALLDDLDPDGPGSAEDGLFGVAADPRSAAVVVIPAPFQATTSFRRGTRDGPMAVREASVQVDLRDRETGEPWRAGIAALELPDAVLAWDHGAEADALAVIAAGGASAAGGADSPALVQAAARVDACCERVNDWVAERARRAMERGAIPAVLGGDHSVAYGAIAAVAERWPGAGVLQIDAHADLRPAYEGFTWSHASIFHNVITHLGGIAHLVQVGLRDVGRCELELQAAKAERITAWFDSDIAWRLAGGACWLGLCERIIEPLPERVYVSFDIDGLEPSLCPNTGTPVPGGLSWNQACVLLRALAGSGRTIVGFDVCEVAPGEGPWESSWDAAVGARLLYKLAGWALATR